MRTKEYLKGILGALGAGEDSGVPTPVWDQERDLEAIYLALKNHVAPSVSAADNGKVLMVVEGAWAAATIPNASGVSF